MPGAELDLAERARRALGVPFTAALGPELIDPEHPAAGVQVSFGDAAGNGAGGAHAAALAAALELAAYLAVAPLLAPDEHAVTVASSLTITRAVPLGVPVRFCGVPDGRTRRIAFATAAALVPGEDDELAARMQATKAITTLR